MNWPPDLLAAFAAALDIEPAEGFSAGQVVRHLLDETARRVAWRSAGDPARVAGALRGPYTPLGSVVGDGLDGRAVRFTLHGDRWGPAVERFYAFVEGHAAEVLAAFADEAEPYHDGV